MLTAIRRNVTWWAILIAGLIAGTVHLIVTLSLMYLFYDSTPALFLRYSGSLLLGPDALVGSGAGVVVVGLLVHYALSVVLAAVIALVVHRWGMLVGLVGGGILGLAFYAINYYALTLWVPWFFAANNPVLLLSHLVFGVTAGGVYEYFDRFDLPMNGEHPHDTQIA